MRGKQRVDVTVIAEYDGRAVTGYASATNIWSAWFDIRKEVEYVADDVIKELLSEDTSEDTEGEI